MPRLGETPDVRTSKPGIRRGRAQSLLSSPIKLAVIIRSYVNQGGCGLTQCSRAHVTASKRETIGTLPTSLTLVPSPQYQWETLKLTPGKHVRGRGCLTEERVEKPRNLNDSGAFRWRYRWDLNPRTG